MNSDRPSRKGPISLIITGAVLCTGPMWGMFMTLAMMIRSFNGLGGPEPGTSEALASDMSAALVSTAVGFLIMPIGIALLVVAIVWLVNVNKRRGASIAQ